MKKSERFLKEKQIDKDIIAMKKEPVLYLQDVKKYADLREKEILFKVKAIIFEQLSPLGISVSRDIMMKGKREVILNQIKRKLENGKRRIEKI